MYACIYVCMYVYACVYVYDCICSSLRYSRRFHALLSSFMELGTRVEVFLVSEEGYQNLKDITPRKRRESRNPTNEYSLLSALESGSNIFMCMWSLGPHDMAAESQNDRHSFAGHPSEGQSMLRPEACHCAYWIGLNSP